jgi:hypothetical protein
MDQLHGHEAAVLPELQTAAEIARDMGTDDPIGPAAADLLAYLKDIGAFNLNRRHRAMVLQAELHLLQLQELVATLASELGADAPQD